MPARFPAGRALRLLAASLVVTGVLTGPGPGAATNELTGVRVLSANDAWAVGTSYDGALISTLILHWNGTKWKQVTSPIRGLNAALTGVAAISSTNAWAVGHDEVSQTLILHWNGTKWKQVASPSRGINAGLTGVSAKPTANAWAVGSFFNGTAEQTLILHCNGTRRSRLATPPPRAPRPHHAPPG